jgi:hypothetical protein
LTTSSQMHSPPDLSLSGSDGCTRSSSSECPGSQYSCHTPHLPARNEILVCRLFSLDKACHTIEGHDLKTACLLFWQHFFFYHIPENDHLGDGAHQYVPRASPPGFARATHETLLTIFATHRSPGRIFRCSCPYRLPDPLRAYPLEVRPRLFPEQRYS